MFLFKHKTSGFKSLTIIKELYSPLKSLSLTSDLPLKKRLTTENGKIIYTS